MISFSFSPPHPPWFQGAAIGVRSNGEDPVTAVRGADGSCRYAIPDRVVPERGQRPENFSPDGSVVESKDVRHVLHEDVSGSKLANGSGHLSPQNGLGVSESLLLARAACALAGEAAGEEDGLLEAMPDVSNIVKDSCSGPALGEDAAAPGVAFAQPQVVPAGEVQPVVEQADA